MASEIKKEIQLEIAHVLFMDIVGYSKLLINEQRALLDALNQIVRSTDEFRTPEAAGRLIKIPTGDGMALVFYNSPEEPVECALDISRALKTHLNLPLRMGVHSGPVSGVIDVNERANVAGLGINMAQRVMDCGDAGHILLSKRVAEDLEQYGHWRPHLHDLGECEVKHGVRVHVVNLYTEELGNPEPPEKFKQLRGKKRIRAAISSATTKSPFPMRAVIGATVLIGVALAVTLLFIHRPSSKTVGTVASPPLSSVATQVSEKSIAVLPFENLSRDPDNAYFAIGIQDEILTRLAKIAALKVISRTSTQQYAAQPGNLSEIARQLGVANILEGSVQKAANNVHINAQLIRAATDEHLWAESYDRNLENIFGVEAEVASAVAEALKAKLTGAEQQTLEQKPTINPEAYDAYLRGIALYRETNSVARSNAMQSLEEAVRLDPNFAVAWAMLARINSGLYFWTDTTLGRRSAAQSSLETALRLQPDLPEVQLAQAFYEYWVLRDFERARRSFEQLRPKLPNNADVLSALAVIARRQARWKESCIYADEAVALNPRDRRLRMDAGYVRVATRDFSAALRRYDDALNIWPGDEDFIAAKVNVYQVLGDLDQADALLNGLRPKIQEGAIETICDQDRLRRRKPTAIRLLQTWLGVMFQDVVRTGRVRQDGGGSTLNPTLSRTDIMHANATLTPLTRAQMALQHTQLDFSLRTTAVAFGVCEKTVRRWLARAQLAGFPQRLHDHSSRPLSQPRKTSAQLEAQILTLRRQRRSYAQIRMVLPISKATLSRILRRHHLNRLSSLEPSKPPPLRYERQTPGDLLHLDIKKLGRFHRPGVRATGDRTQRNPGAGVKSLHVAIDDHSRLAFACLLPDERTPSALIALQQALCFYSAHGIKIQQLLTDRGSTYRSKPFASACLQLGLKHLFTKPYRPQTNGKAERFIQTITREWAYARSYNSSNHRATFLPHYLHDYNFHRPHSALNSLPPSSRLPKTADNVSRYNS